MQDLVSILVPAFNHSDYIADLLNSILDQNYKNIEVYVSDDCSHDNTYDIALSFAEGFRESNIPYSVFKNKINQGICKNMNGLIKRAKGDYIKFISADDILMDNTIEKLVASISKQDYLYVFSNAYLIDGSDHYKVIRKDLIKLLGYVPDINNNYFDSLYSNCFIVAPSVLFRKSTFEKYGLFDERFCAEDYPYWMHLADKGSINYINEPLVYYRVLNKSASHCKKLTRNNAKQLFDMHFYIMDYYKDYIVNIKNKNKLIKNKFFLCHKYVVYGDLYYEKEKLREFRMNNNIQFNIADVTRLIINHIRKFIVYKLHIDI